MKKTLILLIVSLFFPLSTALAFGEFDPGGVYNPIHVEIEPTNQYRNQNLESSLKTQYGNSAFYSCMNKVSSCSGDQSDPSRHYACLQNIEYAFQTPLCRAQQPIQCQAGYTLVNGSCVRQQVTPTACPSGYMFIGTGCTPFTCSAGYAPQGNQCVKAQQNTTPAQPATQPQQPVWNGNITIEQVGAASGSTGGGSAGGGNGPAVESCVRKVLSQDTNFGMLSPDECYATWQAAVEAAVANYESPKAANVAENKEQIAAAALADWQAPVVEAETPQPESRRGFWSWLLSLFGF